MTSIFKWLHEISLKRMEEKQNSIYIHTYIHTYIYIYNFLATPCGLQDLSSQTKKLTLAIAVKSAKY